MKAVVTVIGHDTIGILHKVSGICAEHNANVVEVTQSVLQDLFAMFMLVDITGLNCEFSALFDYDFIHNIVNMISITCSFYITVAFTITIRWRNCLL